MIGVEAATSSRWTESNHRTWELWIADSDFRCPSDCSQQTCWREQSVGENYQSHLRRFQQGAATIDRLIRILAKNSPRMWTASKGWSNSFLNQDGHDNDRSVEHVPNDTDSVSEYWPKGCQCVVPEPRGQGPRLDHLTSHTTRIGKVILLSRSHVCGQIRIVE